MGCYKVRLIAAGALTLAMCSSSALAAVLYQSEMTAPPLSAGNLVGQDGWSNHSGTGTFIQVGATGTTLLQGGGSREDANVGIIPISAGQTYYFGFDVVVDGEAGVAPTTVYFAHFKDAGTGTDFTTRTFVTEGPSGSDFTFALSAAGSNPDVTWASGFAYGSTNRVIGSYDADTNLTQLWVNPTDASSPSISFTDPAANQTAAFALRQAAGNTSQLVSKLVVATSFNEALGTVIPEPSTIALVFASLGGLLIRRK